MDNKADLLSGLPSHDGGGWEICASPKPSALDKKLFGRFVSVYASFSMQFATDALEILARKKSPAVLDPFLGVGTTLAAASQLGMPGTGVDLAPHSIIVSKTRLAKVPSHVELNASIIAPTNAGSPDGFSQDLRDIMTTADLSYFNSLVGSSRSSGGIDLRSILKTSAFPETPQAYAMCLASISANTSARLQKGSNPIWSRRMTQDEPAHRLSLMSLTSELACALAQRPCKSRHDDQQIHWAKATDLPISDSSIEVVLFSPPYLNRLDYVVANYATNYLALDAVGEAIEPLRSMMMGTTKISNKDIVPYKIGNYSQFLLNEIWNHPSKASASYYYWNFVDYINTSMNLAIELQRVMKSNARGCFVVQTSFYKDVKVETHEILAESLRLAGFRTETVRSETVRGHMGRMNPHQARHSPNKTLHEHLVTFSKY